jgi:hypothetical protein
LERIGFKTARARNGPCHQFCIEHPIVFLFSSSLLSETLSFYFVRDYHIQNSCA